METGHSITALTSDARQALLPWDGDYAMECSCTAGDGMGVYDDHC